MAGEAKQTQVKDQETANIQTYARVFKKCLVVAREIVTECGGGDAVEVASTLFRQFNHDQIELVKQNQLVELIKQAMRGGR